MSESPVHDLPALAVQRERTAPIPPCHRFADEDRAWSQLYAAVLQGDAAAAEEVTKVLDADPDAKQLRLALYTHAKTVLRKRRAVDSRNQRIAAALRAGLSVLLVKPFGAVRWMGITALSIASAMWPRTGKVPVALRLNVLHADPNFARTKAKFGASAEVPPSAAEASRSPKAA